MLDQAARTAQGLNCRRSIQDIQPPALPLTFFSRRYYLPRSNNIPTLYALPERRPGCDIVCAQRLRPLRESPLSIRPLKTGRLTRSLPCTAHRTYRSSPTQGAVIWVVGDEPRVRRRRCESVNRRALITPTSAHAKPCKRAGTIFLEFRLTGCAYRFRHIASRRFLNGGKRGNRYLLPLTALSLSRFTPRPRSCMYPLYMPSPEINTLTYLRDPSTCRPPHRPMHL